jgi:hypothetical protein
LFDDRPVRQHRHDRFGACAGFLGSAEGAAPRFVRRGEWLKGTFPLGRKVSGARLGLVGMGRIGRAIAQRSTGFEMDVRYHARRPVADVPWRHALRTLEACRRDDTRLTLLRDGDHRLSRPEDLALIGQLVSD